MFFTFYLNSVMSRSGGGSHTKRLYVGRIPGRATEEDVERFFRPVVKPRQVLLKNGFAFVVSFLFNHLELIN